MIRVVNMIPNGWSDERNQDAEPMLSVNPANPSEIIATAFTYDNPAGSSAVSPQMMGDWAPIYYSTDGGATWSLQFVLPSRSGAPLPTFDVTARFAGTTGNVYSAMIAPFHGVDTILINRASGATTRHETIVTRAGDQPVVEATTAFDGGGPKDRVYVGYKGTTTFATVDQSADAALAPPPAGFGAVSVDDRSEHNGPKTRVAIHGDGTLYAAFYSRNPEGFWDVVVVKDLREGAAMPKPYQALVDASDGKAGVKVAAAITPGGSNAKEPDFGHDRRGFELALAVDPNDDQRLYIVYSSGTGSADYTLHLRRSADGGVTWSGDVRTVLKAKNASLAINMLGDVGFLYQQVVGQDPNTSRWAAVFERSGNDFGSHESHTLSDAPSTIPGDTAAMATYLGDYTSLQSVGKDFYGIFSASNAPHPGNFPSGITFQRNVDMKAGILLGNDGVTRVPVSIDPFFFRASGVDPSADVYVRDWTDSAVSFDRGAEPSTHGAFSTTSDVWNQRANVEPSFNAAGQPSSDVPRIHTSGSNYVFARISRRVAAPRSARATEVTAEFLVADFGLGVPYAAISAEPAVTVTFRAADERLVTAGVPWLLSPASSRNVSLAVQISAPGDPFQKPSLLGSSPGWPGGPGTTIRNDNNKAQRSVTVLPVGRSPNGQSGRIELFARLHNAATDMRDMLVQYAGGSADDGASDDVTVSLYGEQATTLSAGDVLRVPRMLPGENRWLGISIAPDRIGASPSFYDFRELLGGRQIGGFRVVAQPSGPNELNRWNVAAERAMHARISALFGDELPAELVRARDALPASEDVAAGWYLGFLEEHGARTAIFELLEDEIDLDPVDVDAFHRRLAGAVRRGDLVAAANAHSALLNQLDALLSMAQHARGDANALLHNLRWQRALYCRATVPREVVDDVRTRSHAFMQAYQQRGVRAADFPALVRDLLPSWEKTAVALAELREPLQSLRSHAGAAADPAGVQKEHRAFLVALDALVE